MKTYKLETKDFESKNTMNAYRVVFPAGHYMGNDITDTVVFQVKPYFANDATPEVLDDVVLCEKVQIQYPDFLDGAMGEAVLVEATKQRILGRAALNAVEVN